VLVTVGVDVACARPRDGVTQPSGGHEKALYPRYLQLIPSNLRLVAIPWFLALAIAKVQPSQDSKQDRITHQSSPKIQLNKRKELS
jgi:hypothetical protein